MYRVLFVCHGTTRCASLERRINWGKENKCIE